ncbi:peptidyl-prolyl cis-trans isomerase, cyclophilin type [Novosphingobium nitrogenifigens DSM 19370]|uniref:peptidylprolyl isomerase n=1 Tax=Novosphingobium nitrogenifigens DSM 19370 TaxID=983920 RepID=F1Z6E9_9SPHN|nr:peptidylprolyl isomerase [Novosphingobium nitrogenifigens]EGD59931.1 peptidyl-prolyl cis-trans isomerase, cyclophilin type [Novosphingobium nitrogenifigens DSM 19370]
MTVLRFASRAVFASLPLLGAVLAVPATAAPAAHNGAQHHGIAHRDVAPAPIPLADTVRVALVTTAGTIELDLDGKHAPVTTANFLHYVDTKRFDGITFYRAMHLAWGDQPNGLIQAGVRDTRKLFPPIAHEPTSQTGVLHKAGTISMARFAPGTATSDFSILISDMPALDADPKATDPEAQAGFAAFGHVVSGMDVVRKIWDAPISPTLGEGVMKGQMLADPVRVLTARREPLPG